MSERIHVLAQQLFGKSSVDECDLQEIKNLVNRYPFFAPAQFLLLEKLKRDNSPEYSSQLQKAVLYYHDPLEFEYFISSGRFETELNLDEDIQLATADHYDDEDNSLPVIAGADGEVIDLPAEETGTVEAPPEEIPGPVHAPGETASTVTEPELSVPHEEKMSESIEKVLVQEEKQINEPADNNQMVFEPYHTVDYFASQGIKLSVEDVPKDKFGKQLKTFTEWLKTMKRLPPTEMSRDVDPSTETKVQHLAEHSVHQSDVLTEAMAEVWIKQGNKEKAIETYNKLGLLNPSKKAYFAGLIENLKRS
jgi:hypothetical protein